jgi:hypothetical protein
MSQSLGCLLLHNSELHKYFSINFQVYIRNNQRELNVLVRRLPFLRKIFFPQSQLCSVLAVKKGIRCQTHCRKHCFMNEVPFSNQKRTPNLTLRILILMLITFNHFNAVAALQWAAPCSFNKKQSPLSLVFH